MNYARKRYGDNLSYLGNGHGYANGGLITRHQFAEIGENNQPEMIIPLDAMKSSRGFELLGKTAVAMAARDGATASNGDMDLAAKLEKSNNLLNTMTQLLAGILGQTELSNQPLDNNSLNSLSKSMINRAVRAVN